MTTQPRITTFRPYAVNHSSAKMPSSVSAPYRHGCIIKTDGANDHGFVAEYHGSKIVEYSGKLHAGGKRRDAFSDWLKQAYIDCACLNDVHEIEMMAALGCAPWRIEAARQGQPTVTTLAA
jgi:hypothetical protein